MKSIPRTPVKAALVLAVAVLIAAVATPTAAQEAAISASLSKVAAQTLLSTAPMGHADSIVAVPGGAQIEVMGWAADSSTPSTPVEIRVVVTVTNVSPLTTGGIYPGITRPDVARVYPWAGSNTGYLARVPALAGGFNNVCVFAVSTRNAGLVSRLRCQTVTVSGMPSRVLPTWGAPTWSDEFNSRDAKSRPAVDPAKWDVKDRSSFGLLNDASIIDRNQVNVSTDGVLHIRGDWLSSPVKTSTGPSGANTERWHKTGYLDHRKTGGGLIYAQQYGRWEIRAKVPTGTNTLGALAAFWLRNGNSGEIDMMEAWGVGTRPYYQQKPGTSTTTVHGNTMGGGGKVAWTLEDQLKKKGIASAHVSDAFHVWAFELTPQYAAMLKDGIEVFRTTPGATPLLWGSSFKTPLHLRLNLHVGPSVKYWGLPNAARKFETGRLDFQVDYVRVYRYGG